MCSVPTIIQDECAVVVKMVLVEYLVLIHVKDVVGYSTAIYLSWVVIAVDTLSAKTGCDPWSD